METPEALQQCVRREQQMIARLRLAMTRLADAERERIWAIVAAKEAGLSIRQTKRVRSPCGSVSSKTSASHLQCSQKAYHLHRRPPRRLSRWEERAASRQALGLPPYERS